MPKEQNDQTPKQPIAKRRSPHQQPNSQVYMHRNQRVHVPDGYFAVGRITGPHGLKGEVKVELHTDFPERFTPDTKLFIGEDLTEATIIVARPAKNQMLLLLEGIKDRNQAEALRDEWLFVDEADAVELEEDTYWVHDIVGLQVQTEEGQRLGTIREVLFTGANEVYVVQTEATVNQGKDLLLPAIADVVQTVDLPNQMMIVRLLPGLLEE